YVTGFGALDNDMRSARFPLILFVLYLAFSLIVLGYVLIPLWWNGGTPTGQDWATVLGAWTGLAALGSIAAVVYIPPVGLKIMGLVLSIASVGFAIAPAFADLLGTQIK